jgi:hypothetical protein
MDDGTPEEAGGLESPLSPCRAVVDDGAPEEAGGLRRSCATRLKPAVLWALCALQALRAQQALRALRALWARVLKKS